MRRAVIPLLMLCLLLTGCAPQEEPPPPAEEIPPLTVEEKLPIVVQTDWSQLGEREKLPPPVGTRRYEDYTAALIPADDYGQLIPYAGLRLMADWPADDGCLYGLMTREGEVVVDPVYSSVYAPRGHASDGTSFVHPLLILRQGYREPHKQDFDVSSVCAVAAADGSWCTAFDYVDYRVSEHGLLLFTADSLHVMSPDGTITHKWSSAQMGLTGKEYESFLSELSWHEGVSGWRVGDYLALNWDPAGDYDALLYFDIVSGERGTMTLEEWNSLESHVEWVTPQIGKNGAAVYDALLGFDAPYLVYTVDYTGDYMLTHYHRADGSVIEMLENPANHRFQRVKLVGGLVEVQGLDHAAYYELDTLECVFRTYFSYDGD